MRPHILSNTAFTTLNWKINMVIMGLQSFPWTQMRAHPTPYNRYWAVIFSYQLLSLERRPSSGLCPFIEHIS